LPTLMVVSWPAVIVSVDMIGSLVPAMANARL
jgi:hypothetical protein